MTFLRFSIFLVFGLYSNFAWNQCNADAGPNVTTCDGVGVTIGGSPTGPGGATYVWSPAAGLNNVNAANPVANPSATTTYTVTMTVGGNTCTDQVTVTVNPNPTASFSFGPNNVCSNQDISFLNTSTGSGLSYLWDFDNPAHPNPTTTQQSPDHDFHAPGSGAANFNVSLTVTDNNGCTDNDIQTVTVSETPDAVLMDPFTNFRNCDGSPFNITLFDNSVPTANANYQIIWGDGSPDFNSATFSGAGETHTYAPGNIYTLQYIVTGTNGCTDTSEYLISNITNPAVGVANPGATNGCGPLTLCFPISNYAGNHISTIYTVDYGDGSPIDTFPHPVPDPICHTYTQTSCGAAGGAFTFTISAINACDQSVATVSPIRVYTGPEAHFSAAPIPQCVNTAVTFTNTSIAGFNSTCSDQTFYVWDFGDGTTLNAFTNAAQTHSYAAPGTYTVSLTASNSCGSTSETHDVCIEEPPTPGFSLTPDNGCIPLQVQTNNLSTATNICDTTNTWTVIFNGSACLPATGTFNFINGTHANSLEPEFEFLDPGEYIIRLTVTNSCGTFTHDDTVNAYTIPEIILNPIADICEGDQVSPTATFTDCDNPITAYAWTFPTGSPGTDNTDTPGPVIFNTAGNVTISVDATNSCGTSTESTSFVVNAAPLPPTVSSNSPICEGDTIFLESNTIAGATYNWTGPNGFSSTLEDPFIINTTAANAGLYSLSVSANGCGSASADVNVTIDPTPVVNVVPNPSTICEGDTVQLTASGANSYSWSPAADLSASTGTTVDAFPTTNATVTVTGTTGGCADSVDVIINVNTLPVVDAGPDITLCNQPIGEQLSGTPAGGTWSGPNVNATGLYTPNGVTVDEIIYSYTDGNSCSQTDTLYVTVVNPTPVNVGNDTAVCINSGIFNLAGNPVGGTWSGTNMAANGDYNPVTSGIFTVTYSLGSGSCLTTDNLDITVNDLPVVDAGLDQSICVDNGILALNGSPAGGSWSGTAVDLSGNFDPSISGAGTFTLTYTYADPATQCDNSDIVNISVNALPIVDAGPDFTACNQPVAVNITSGTPAGGTWSGPNITNPSGEFTPNGTGVFTVYYSYTDGNGCTSLDSLDITVINPTNADAGADTAVCIDAGLINLAASPTGGTWSGTGVGGSQFDPGLAGTGNFTLTYTVGTGSCLTSDDVDFTVNDLPIINPGNDFDICIDAAPLNLNPAPAGGTWSGNGITNPTGEFTASVAGLGAHILSYTYTDPATGCSSTATITATVNALPIVDAGNDTTLCNQPIPVQFNGSPSGGAWSGPDITAGGQFTPNGTGTFTVTYTYTLGSGCSDSDDIDITVVNPVQADAGLDLEACFGDPIFNIAGAPVGGTWTGSVQVQSNGDFDPSTSGTYTLTYSIGQGNCLTTDQMDVIVHDLPTVDAGADQDFCVSSLSVDFIGSPAGGTWSGTGITDPIVGTFDPSTAGVGVFDIVYTYTDPITSCVNTDTLIATINDLPIPSFTNNPIACVNVAETFNNTSTGASSYQWDFGDGNTSNNTNPSHSYTSTGIYTIQLIATSGAGCVDSTNGTIEVLEPPTALFTVAPDSGCGPLNVAFNNQSFGQNISFSWNFGNGNTSTLQSPINEIYPAGIIADSIYYIQLDVTNFCGTVSHLDSVQVMPEPVSIFGTNVNIGCSPATFEFSNTSIGLPDVYTWDFGNGVTSNEDDSLFNMVFTTGANDTTYTIMMIAENECGVDTSYHTITVLPNQVTAFFNADTLVGCDPLTVNFSQFSQNSNAFSWDFGDGNVSTQYNPTHTFVAPGVYTVQLFADDGCSYDTTSIDITVNGAPFVDFSSTPDSVCVNEEFSFNNLSGALAGMTWDFGDGNSSTLTNPTHSYTATGTYNVTLTGISATNGCPGSVTKPVVVSINPIADFSFNPQNGCMPLPVSFTNNSSDADFYEWYFGDGNSSTNTNPNHTYGSDGNYTITLVASRLNGCTDTTEQIVVVHPLPVAGFNLSQDSSCYSPVTIGINSTAQNAVNYSYDLGNGNTSALNSPAATYNGPGTYAIQQIVSNTFGCLDTAVHDFTVYPTPVANFEVDSDTSCELYPVSFTNLSTNETSWEWGFGDGGSSNVENPIYQFSDSGSYNVTLMVYGDGGCGDTITLATPIVIYPSPIAAFSYVNIQNPDPLSGTVEFTNESIGADSYLWQFGDGSASTEIDPTYRYFQIGTFNTYLIAYNDFGCVDTAFQGVEVEYFKGLHIPNAMNPGHPNFEVANFVPKGVGLETYHILIYDAWGNLIWESTALDSDGRPTESWDGTFNGVPLPQDAYVWRVSATFRDRTLWVGKEYEGGLIRRSGTVTIIR
jgi:PKD repeat protein